MDGGETIKQTIRQKYGAEALNVLQGRAGGGCGTGCGCGDPITSNLYDATDTATLPEPAVLASLGCGNPTALADLRAGCVAGALEIEEFKALLAASGFADVSIEPTRVYDFDDAARAELNGRIM